MAGIRKYEAVYRSPNFHDNIAYVYFIKAKNDKEAIEIAKNTKPSTPKVEGWKLAKIMWHYGTIYETEEEQKLRYTRRLH